MGQHVGSKTSPRGAGVFPTCCSTEPAAVSTLRATPLLPARPPIQLSACPQILTPWIPESILPLVRPSQ